MSSIYTVEEIAKIMGVEPKLAEEQIRTYMQAGIGSVVLQEAAEAYQREAYENQQRSAAFWATDFEREQQKRKERGLWYRWCQFWRSLET